MSWENEHIVSGTLNQSILGKTAINKLFYKIVARTVDIIIEEMLLLLAEVLVTSITSVQSTSLFHSTQNWLDETDGLGSLITSFGRAGVITATEDLPTANAYGMTKAVGSRLTRPGSLRIAGVTEVGAVGNTLNPATIILLDAIGEVLDDTKIIIDSGGNSMTFEPVVVGRLPSGALDLTKVQPILAVSSPRLTTQVSRRV